VPTDATVHDSPDLPRVVLGAPRRAPHDGDAELAASAVGIVVGAEQLGPAMRSWTEQLDAPTMTFCVAESIFDAPFRMAPSGHGTSL